MSAFSLNGGEVGAVWDGMIFRWITTNSGDITASLHHGQAQLDSLLQWKETKNRLNVQSA